MGEDNNKIGTNNNGGGNNSNPPFKDNDGNEITPFVKYLSGSFLIGLTVFSALYLIGHWPDRLASPRENIKPLYTYRWFHVRLVGIPDTGSIRYFSDSTGVVTDPGYVGISQNKTDTIRTDTMKNRASIDSARKINDSIRRSSSTSHQFANKKFPPEDKLMHINTLLLVLVAVAGFLGNMIYVGTSFTTFIGNGQYKKSWGLWYYVKPFTAAALALAIYFVFRGGFLNMSDESTNINLYGLMTISILAGLFTDRTTLKLKEVFDVLLQPKEERKGKLAEEKPVVSNIEAPVLEAGKESVIKITGKNLDKEKLVVKIDGKEITPSSRQAEIIILNYTLAAELKDKDSVKLEIVGQAPKSVYGLTDLKIKKDTPSNSGPANMNRDDTPPGDENQQDFGDPDEDDDTNKPKE